MATSKVNIFNSLPQHLDESDGEDNSKVQNRRNDKRDNKTTDKKVNTVGKEDHGRHKDAPKTKGVSEQPHPQDRHSGTGNQAYGGKPKKGGAGKGNWGNYKDEKRTAEEPKEAGAEGTEEVAQAPVEEEPTGISLQEYYAKQRLAQNEPQINEAKAKITSEQLKKELGTATLLKSRQQQEIDDRNAGKKKSTLDINHKAAINTENAALLNFRTGFVERELRKPRTEEDFANAKRGPRTGGRREERENAKEEEPKTQTATTEEQKPVEGTTTEATATPAEGTQERRRENGNRGGQRGGRGGYRGGNKPHHGGRKPQEAKINFEDESAFPKLG